MDVQLWDGVQMAGPPFRQPPDSTQVLTRVQKLLDLQRRIVLFLDRTDWLWKPCLASKHASNQDASVQAGLPGTGGREGDLDILLDVSKLGEYE